MPTYEFRCNDTGKLFEITVRSIRDYDPDAVRSPFTGSANLSRIIRKVNFQSGGKLDALMQGDEGLLQDLEHTDPQTLGRFMKAMASEAGEDMGTEFNEIVDRLKKGQSPEEIESSLPSIPEDSP